TDSSGLYPRIGMHDTAEVDRQKADFGFIQLPAVEIVTELFFDDFKQTGIVLFYRPDKRIDGDDSGIHAVEHRLDVKQQAILQFRIGVERVVHLAADLVDECNDQILG